MKLKKPLTSSMKLRELQRDTKRVLGFLSTNPENYIEILDGRGKTVYCVISLEGLRQRGLEQGVEQETPVANDRVIELLELLCANHKIDTGPRVEKVDQDVQMNYEDDQTKF
ncbi:MAG: hypothetical protein GY861_18470 [bacterium]|nr:hypothetical protein [bacterium]